MQIRHYIPSDAPAVLQLWDTAGVRAGYAPQDEAGLRALLLAHSDFSAAHTFVLDVDGQAQGFINGCTGAHLAQGAVRGYVSCLLLSEALDTDENARVLLTALEDSFRQAGKSVSAVTFFNPIRLPWIIPGTPGHQHNNMPGVPRDLPLYGRMLRCGYREAATEMAMYLDLSAYAYPPAMAEKERAMAQEGYTVARYQPGLHEGLDDTLSALGNSMWSSEIPAAASAGQYLLVGLKGHTVAGFTGPIYPEPSGRGYFAGLGVAPQYEGHGLGTLLFNKLCLAERACGAQYMSLFTGVNNPAQRIYQAAGFTPRRYFAVMIKEL